MRDRDVLFNRNISDLLEDDVSKRCFYCGMPADTKDHIIPKSILKALEDLLKHPIKIETVPACRECNCTILGSNFFNTIEERLDYVKFKLRKRYSKYVRYDTYWTKEELSDLGYNLRNYIENSLLVGKVTQERLEWNPEMYPEKWKEIKNSWNKEEEKWRICRCCGERFILQGKLNKICDNCKSKNKQYELKCVTCEEIFIAGAVNAKYCKNCKSKIIYYECVVLPIKVCELCRKEYKPITRSQRYCSPTCRILYHEQLRSNAKF